MHREAGLVEVRAGTRIFELRERAEAFEIAEDPVAFQNSRPLSRDSAHVYKRTQLAECKHLLANTIGKAFPSKVAFRFRFHRNAPSDNNIWPVSLAC